MLLSWCEVAIHALASEINNAIRLNLETINLESIFRHPIKSFVPPYLKGLIRP